MKEFKIRYNHDKAQEILEKIGAKFEKREILEDIYLIDNGKDIYKISRLDGVIKFVHLINQGNGFQVDFISKIEKLVQEKLSPLFREEKIVMRKERNHYKWKDSIITLDVAMGLGEFIELYPANDQERQSLFTAFNVLSEDLIHESYNALRTQK